MASTEKNRINMANLEQYRAVLEDLQKQRNELQFKIGEIDVAVAALRRIMPGEDRGEARPLTQPTTQPIRISPGKYAGMGVRWATLNFLCEDATGPTSTGAIAEALKEGGVQSESKSFAGNVSAVLSDMNHKRNEVESTRDGWFVTEKGKSVWIHIKASRERERTNAGWSQPSASVEIVSPTELELLPVQ